MPKPTVSVIIPAFNRAQFIGNAIRSILHQSLREFELIVVDDGSTDGTAQVVRSFDDPRLSLIRHDRNRGIPAARNTGLENARGTFIAWLDSDDVARPQRLAEQVQFLKAHPQIKMVGACAGKIGPGGIPVKGTRVPPLSRSDISAWLLFRSPFQQSSIMGNGEVMRSFGYREEFPVCEDLDVFIRMARSHPVENMPRVLIDRRIHANQSIRLHGQAVMDCSVRLVSGPLAELGMCFSEVDLRRHVLLGKPWAGKERPDKAYLQWADDWMQQLREANRRSGLVDGKALDLATSFFWLLTCKAAGRGVGHARVAATYMKSRLSIGLASSHARSWIGTALGLMLLGG